MKTSMEEIKRSWEDEYVIPFYGVDAKNEVCLPALWNLMQETAWHHADHLKLGYHDLAEKKSFWVLSRLSIQMDEYPHWGNRIRIKTWLAGTGRLFALRHFSIAHQKGDILGMARSAWLVLSSKSRRPQRIEPLFQDMGHLFDPLPLTEEPERLPGPVQAKVGKSFTVRYSDIDMHHHAHNTKYIEWILDSYSAERLRMFHIQSLETNFLAECSQGDEITIHTEPSGNTPPIYLHSLFRKSDHRELCRARVLWRPMEKVLHPEG